MKFTRFAILIIASAFISCSFWNEDKTIIENTAKEFAEDFFCGQISKAVALCTENGKDDVKWYVSNLSENDIKLIKESPNVEIKESQCSDTSAIVCIALDNVLQCDSLEKSGKAGYKEMSLRIKKTSKGWLIDGLEW